MKKKNLVKIRKDSYDWVRAYGESGGGCSNGTCAL